MRALPFHAHLQPNRNPRDSGSSQPSPSGIQLPQAGDAAIAIGGRPPVLAGQVGQLRHTPRRSACAAGLIALAALLGALPGAPVAEGAALSQTSAGGSPGADPQGPKTSCVGIEWVDPKIVQLGPIVCKCGGQETDFQVAIPLGSSSVRIQPGGAGSNGGLICYASTYDIPGHYVAAKGSQYLVTFKSIPSQLYKGACDLSGCGSLLWGLASWGGPACRSAGPTDSTPVIGLTVLDFCEVPKL